jgi:hypothetical protein
MYSTSGGKTKDAAWDYRIKLSPAPPESFFIAMNDLYERTAKLQVEAIRRLRYLETPVCRASMPEEERRKQIVEVTQKFREILLAKDIVKRVQEYDLYG